MTPSDPQDALQTLVNEFVKSNQEFRRALEDLAASLTEWEETHEKEKKFPKPAKFYDYFYIEP